MLRWRSALVAGVALAALAGWFWLGESNPLEPETTARPVAVPDVDAPAGAQGLTLKGRVLDSAGRPLPGAEVSLAPTGQPLLGARSCEHCELALLSCRSAPTAIEVARLLDEQVGAPVAARTVRSGPGGEFSFERLKGVSFSVWASAQGFGQSLHERAAPGELLELVLPPLRSLAGVVEDERGAPVSGARLRSFSMRLGKVHEARSDEEGLFEIAGLGEGPFFVLAEAEGLLPATIGSVEAGPRPVRLRLMAPRKLRVTVQRAGSRVDARVLVAGDHLERSVESRNGEALFDRLFPQEVLVSAVDGELAATARTVKLEASETHVTLELEPGAKLAVAVIDPEGRAVPKAEAELATESQSISRARRRGDEEMNFGPLVPGNYTLRVRAEGYESQAIELTLAPGARKVEVTLEPSTLIVGRVLDEYGRAAPEISVLIRPTGSNVLSDAAGRFVAEVPSPGAYQLEAHHSDWGGGHANVTAPAFGVELRLEPRAGVEVAVTVDGRRVEGADAVMIVDDDSTFRSDRPSGSDGLVRVRGLPAGRYTLVATHPEYLPSQGTAITLEEGQLLRVEAQLRPGAAIEGEVVDNLGAPLSGAFVTTNVRTGVSAVSDERGHFVLEPLKANSRYTLIVRHPLAVLAERPTAETGGPPVRIVLELKKRFRGRVLSEDGQPLRRFKIDQELYESADGRFEAPIATVDGNARSPRADGQTHVERVVFMVDAADHQPLMVDRPASPELGDLVLRRSSPLVGRVEENGVPVEGAIVGCDACEESLLSSSDGSFRLSWPAGVTELTVTAQKGKRWADLRAQVGQSSPLVLQLAGSVRVWGVAYRADGTLAAGAELTGTCLDRPQPITVVTGADGSYSARVAPGAYRFSLADPSVRAGQPSVVIVELRSEERRLDFGPAPGTHALIIRIPAPLGRRAVWVVQGDVSEAAAETFDLMRAAYAQLFMYRFGEAITVQGLPPGRYTVLSGASHSAGGGTRQVVDVPGSSEVLLQ